MLFKVFAAPRLRRVSSRAELFFAGAPHVIETRYRIMQALNRAVKGVCGQKPPGDASHALSDSRKPFAGRGLRLESVTAKKFSNGRLSPL